MDNTKVSERLDRVRAEMGDWGWRGFEPWIESARSKDPEATRDLLAALTIQLRELSFPSSTISVDLAHFAAEAFVAFLGAAELTLDKAFGLAKGRGAPATAKADHIEIARRTLLMRRAKKSWNDVCAAAVTQEWAVTDERELRRIYARFQARALADEITRRLDEDKDTPVSGV